jgi:hypothetical protein
MERMDIQGRGAISTVLAAAIRRGRAPRRHLLGKLCKIPRIRLSS